MTARTAVLVTGSRDWWDYQAIADRLAIYPRGTIMLHGDCGRVAHPEERKFPFYFWLGADKIAAQLSEQRFHFKSWPLPYFSDLGKAGGPARNKAMLNILATLAGSGFVCAVEAFPLGESRGTRGCIAMAKTMAANAFREPLVIHVTEGRHV